MTDQIEKENLPEISKPMHPAAIGASLFLDVVRFEHAQRVAKMLATSTMIPEHFRNNIGNCLIALNLAERFMADPFMVMQNVYIVHGRPGLEGKLVIALVNQCGKFSPLQYKFTRDNSGKATACTAYATHKETKEVLEQTVTWVMVHAEGWDAKKGSKWMTMPELMFQYRSATFFARVYCPEVILGMQTTDEIFDFVDMKNQAGMYKVENTNASDLSEKIKKSQKEEKKPPTKDVDSEPSEPEHTETTEEKKDLQKMEEEPKEETPGDFRDEWINKRGPGFSTYFHKNRERFEKAPVALQREAKLKWEDLYPRTLWPLENPGEPDSEEDKISMIKAMGDYFEQSDITQALHQHDQSTLTDCDMAMLRTIYKYLRENVEKPEDLA